MKHESQISNTNERKNERGKEEGIIYLAAVFLSPSKNSALALTAAHESFHLFAVHALRLCSVCDTVPIFEINTVLVEEVKPLLFVIYRYTDKNESNK